LPWGRSRRSSADTRQLAKALNKAGLLAVRVGGTGGSSQTSARLTGLAGMRGVAFWFVLRLPIDTSVWLDMATRREGQKWIVSLRVLKFQGKLELLVPRAGHRGVRP
jgi:hypothetical protein